jgi:DNA polymerase III delta prime subunit
MNSIISNNEFCPWVEKHRPKRFNDIVFDRLNKTILQNILDTGYFPNLLFYGPPGTGKTTTIINLINTYQQKYNHVSNETINHKEFMIHLNASDERGIDIIRNQISFFVNSKPLFHQGMKFVVLDEVDYMTKNAQQALRYLLQNCKNNIRFCLICNYISRIDEGLQNEFLRLRFNQLPEKDIVSFLKKVSIKEQLKLTENSLGSIQRLYKSDIRSMLNFMQSNQNVLYKNIIIMNETVWEKLFVLIETKNNCELIRTHIHKLCIKYNLDKKNIVKEFLNYIIRNKRELLDAVFLDIVESIMHFQECNNDTFINYFVAKFVSFMHNSSSS